jgi:hypothetical protein
MFYVYIHRKRTTREIFYVGKGKNKRAFDFSDRGSHWERTVKKHGVIVEIVESGLQEWYALELESDLISLHGRLDLGDGLLINKTDGGDGISGCVYSEESKQKIRDASKNRWSKQEEHEKFSKSLIGNKRNLGKQHSKETKEKCRQVNLGKKLSETHKEKVLNVLKAYWSTEENKKKASERLKGNQYAKGLNFSEESRLKISLGNKGKVRSEEAKANYRAAHARRKQEKISSTTGITNDKPAT